MKFTVSGHIETDQDGNVIWQDVTFQPTADTQTNRAGLRTVWRSPMPFDEFLSKMDYNNYIDGPTEGARWQGTPQELRALYEVLIGYHIPRRVSRAKFFKLAKQTFVIKYKDVTSIKDRYWDFQKEFEALQKMLLI